MPLRIWVENGFLTTVVCQNRNYLLIRENMALKHEAGSATNKFVARLFLHHYIVPRESHMENSECSKIGKR